MTFQNVQFHFFTLHPDAELLSILAFVKEINNFLR